MTKNDIIDLLDFIEDNDVRFIRLQFCDLYGNNRNISVSYSELERALKEGLSFTSSNVPGYAVTGEPDLLLFPDASTIKTLPWRPQQGSVARVLCSVCYPDGQSFEGDSREILSQVLAQAQKQDIDFEIGAKIEFYLFELDEEGNPTRKPADEAGFFDLAPRDKCENTRREIILTLEEMGFSITSSHHERGSGQNEIDFRMSDPLSCADNIQTFKSVVKTIAERNGMHATFMPKPLDSEPGSGMHIVLTAFKDNKNLFTTPDGELSEDGFYFIGGILSELPGMTLFLNPIVNSYKRLASIFKSGKSIGYQQDSVNKVIRIPKTRNDVIRLILETPDGSANPYLLFALIISSGLKGIKDKINPDEIELTLPDTLLDAIKTADSSNFINEVIDEKIKDEFLRIKFKEWQDYINTIHDWEIDQYFKTI